SREATGLVDGLGTAWAIEPPSLKSYGCHVTQQAVVAAVQDFKRGHALDPASLTRVVIRGPHRIMEARHTERAPRDVLGGQYSLPFTTAVALTRDLADPLAYDEAAVRDPLVRDLAQRIELEPVERPGPEIAHVWPAEVYIDDAAGHHVLHTRPHKGSP